jgi:pimeloyl-ACP methyl ester carboxylesterase
MMMPSLSVPALVLALGVFARAADPDLVPIPPVTGKYNVGATKQVIELYSENDPTAPGGIQSEYLATIYYPTLDKPSEPKPFVEPELAEIMEQAYGINPGTIRRAIASISWDASYLPRHLAGRGLPTLILGPGGLGPPSDCYVTIISDLVSHGYVIAALDHPYEQPFLRFPNGTGLFGLPADYVPELDEIERLVDARVNDTLHFIDNYPDLVAKLKAPFKTSVFGAFGHSLGGAVAAEAAYYSDKLRSALNMDGSFWNRANSSSPDADLGKPVMLFGSEPHRPEGDPSWRTFPEVQTDWWRLFLVTGTVHREFSDATFWKTIDAFEGLGTIDGVRMVDIMRTYVRAFFDKTLLCKKEPLLEGDLEEYPEVVLLDGSED